MASSSDCDTGSLSVSGSSTRLRLGYRCQWQPEWQRHRDSLRVRLTRSDAQLSESRSDSESRLTVATSTGY